MKAESHVLLAGSLSPTNATPESPLAWFIGTEVFVLFIEAAPPPKMVLVSL